MMAKGFKDLKKKERNKQITLFLKFEAVDYDINSKKSTVVKH